MPTFFVTRRFWRDYGDLSPQEQELFHDARVDFVEGLKIWESQGCHGNPEFARKLGVKSMVVNKKRYIELAWADDGRCVWELGPVQHPGKCHVIWRRIGSHRIYDDP